MSKVSVIITAGGTGKRMGSSLPKQFLQVEEKPVLMYTIELFYHFDPNFQIIITLPNEWKEYWEDLVEEHDFKIPHRVVEGGKERYDSIKNALAYCLGDYIAVHDGVRPLVSHETLAACFNKLQSANAVIPVVELKESLRKVEGENSFALNRVDYRLVQTPQCFSKDLLIRAYDQPYSDEITDDASLVEKLGESITMVVGNDENIKITTQLDLALANLLLK